MPSCSDCNFCRNRKVHVNCTTGLSMDGFDGPTEYAFDFGIPGFIDDTTFLFPYGIGTDYLYISPNLYTFSNPCSPPQTSIITVGARAAFVGLVLELPSFDGSISGNVGCWPFATPNVEQFFPTGFYFFESEKIYGAWGSSVATFWVQPRFDFTDTCDYNYSIHITMTIHTLDQFGGISHVRGDIQYDNHINIYNNFDTLDLYRRPTIHQFGIFGNYLGDYTYEPFGYFPYGYTGIKNAAGNSLLAWTPPDTITLTAIR